MEVSEGLEEEMRGIIHLLRVLAKTLDKVNFQLEWINLERKKASEETKRILNS